MLNGFEVDLGVMVQVTVPKLVAKDATNLEMSDFGFLVDIAVTEEKELEINQHGRDPILFVQ